MNYCYAFNGKENDKDFGNDQLVQDYGFRIYNPELGRFLSVDPLSKSYPSWSPYPFAMDRPIDGIDLDGAEYVPKQIAEFGYFIEQKTNSAFDVLEDVSVQGWQVTKGTAYAVYDIASSFVPQNETFIGETDTGQRIRSDGSIVGEDVWRDVIGIPSPDKIIDNIVKTYQGGNLEDQTRLTLNLGFGAFTFAKGVKNLKIKNPNHPKTKTLVLRDGVEEGVFNQIYQGIKEIGGVPSRSITLTEALSVEQARKLMNLIPDREIGLLKEVSQSGFTQYHLVFGIRNKIRFEIPENVNLKLIFHTHPSGNPVPSQADVDMLKFLRQEKSFIIPNGKPVQEFNQNSKTLN